MRIDVNSALHRLVIFGDFSVTKANLKRQKHEISVKAATKWIKLVNEAEPGFSVSWNLPASSRLKNWEHETKRKVDAAGSRGLRVWERSIFLAHE
jgi:hypothetical protein